MEKLIQPHQISLRLDVIRALQIASYLAGEDGIFAKPINESAASIEWDNNISNLNNHAALRSPYCNKACERWQTALELGDYRVLRPHLFLYAGNVATYIGQELVVYKVPTIGTLPLVGTLSGVVYDSDQEMTIHNIETGSFVVSPPYFLTQDEDGKLDYKYAVIGQHIPDDRPLVAFRGFRRSYPEMFGDNMQQRQLIFDLLSEKELQEA